MAKFNIEEMVERSRSIPYILFLGTCVNWTKSMTAEERQETISGCNQKIDEVKKISKPWSRDVCSASWMMKRLVSLVSCIATSMLMRQFAAP